ncbi:uncharacterized protein LOC117327299 [Pecten maximus]|uniref:uncharacterized protein LOC117327299 n=1 Tax=Pecten maximus TaxID=6579 RepID=UPI001458F022|nr:uncharacterized protein LOC117327299 [Pecten maximus]
MHFPGDNMEATLQSAILKLPDNKRTLKRSKSDGCLFFCNHSSNSLTVTSLRVTKMTKSIENLTISHHCLGFPKFPSDNCDNDNSDVKSLPHRSIRTDSVLIPVNRRDAKVKKMDSELNLQLTAYEVIAIASPLLKHAYVGCISFLKHLLSVVFTEKRRFGKENRHVWTLKFLKYFIIVTMIACIISNRNLCCIFLHFCIISGIFKSVKLNSFTSGNFNLDFNENMKTKNLKEYKGCKPYRIEKISWLLKMRPRKVFLNVFPSSLKLYFENAQNGTGDASPMNIEWLRLKSFASASLINARPIRLSRAGFYYTGTSDEVECYSCGIRRSNWEVGDDPADLHRQMSPHCRHVCGTDDTNVPIPRNAENMHSPTANSGTTQDINNESFPLRDSDLYSSCEFPTSARDDMVQHGIENQHQNQPNTPVRNLDIHQENPSVEQTGNGIYAPPKHMSKQTKQHIPVTSSPTRSPQETKKSYAFSTSTQSCSKNKLHAQCRNSSSPIPGTRNQKRNAFRRRELDNGSRIGDNTNRNSQLNTRNPLPMNPSNQTSTFYTNKVTSGSVSASAMQKLVPLGVNFDKPKYPAYAVLTVRMSSFSGWSCSQTPNLMAEAGFVYAGYADYTRCFFCGGGLKNWEDGDDPWIEHARWFPNCAYLRQNKGIEFIQLVHERLDGQEQVNDSSRTREEQQEVVGGSSSENFLSEKDTENLPAFQKAVQQGHSTELVRQAVKQLVDKGIKDIQSSDILEEISRQNSGENQGDCRLGYTQRGNEGNTRITDTDEREMRQLMEENRRLTKEKTCRICEEEDASITFLPCAHLVCCQVCAQAVRRCPVCGVIIQGSIKTWLT